RAGRWFRKSVGDPCGTPRAGMITGLNGIEPEGPSSFILAGLRFPLFLVCLPSSAMFGFAKRPGSPPPAPATPAQDMVRLQFPNSDVADVLREYETLTGKRVITDNFVQGKVNIFLSKEVPREEAIQIIKISLLMNGFSLVPEDP